MDWICIAYHYVKLPDLKEYTDAESGPPWYNNFRLKNENLNPQTGILYIWVKCSVCSLVNGMLRAHKHTKVNSIHKWNNCMVMSGFPWNNLNPTPILSSSYLHTSRDVQWLAMIDAREFKLVGTLSLITAI